MLELLLGLVAQMLCNSAYGALLISGESSERLIRACKTLIDVHTDIPEPQRLELRDLLKRSSEAFQERHRYVHGSAIPNSEGGISNFRARRLKPGPEITPVDLEALEQLAETLKTLTLDVTHWIAVTYGEDQGEPPSSATES